MQQDPGPAEGRRRLDRTRVLPVALLCAVALLAVLGYRVSAGEGYPLDDSWIHFAYARNLIEGSGFAATPGEPTPGATSPLWVLLLAPGFLFGDVHAVWPWLLGALALGGCASLAWLTARRLIGEGGDLPALACGLCVALSGPLVWSAAGAMEVPLFAAMVLLSILLFGSGAAGLRRGLFWGIATGLAALARPEGLLLLVMLPVLALLERNRRAALEAVAGTVVAALVYSPSVAFSLSTSGRIFPNTFYAKTTQLVAGAPDISFLGGATKFWFTESPVSAVGAIAGIAMVVLALRAKTPSRVPLALLGFALGLPLAYAMMGRTYLFAGLAGNFGRYLYPMFVPALVLGFWAFATVICRLAPGRARAVALAVGLVAVGVTLVGTARRAELYAHNVADINALQVEMARHLSDRLPSGSLVAANDVGALAYLTDFRVLDLIGIISTQTLERLEAAGPDPRQRMQALYDLLREERPDAFVVFPQWYGPILNALGDGATEFARTTKRDNITGGGSLLVAFRVDWPPR